MYEWKNENKWYKYEKNVIETKNRNGTEQNQLVG